MFSAATFIFLFFIFLFFSQTGKMRHSKCSSMSSRLIPDGIRAPLIGQPSRMLQRWRGAWTPLRRATLYIWESRSEQKSVCRRRPKPEPDPEPWDIYSSRILKSSSAPYPVGLRTVYLSRRRKKSGEMNSVYQHLISLLFVFSSLHVNHLAEGCSCALTHPQDAFCNSDIGE